LDLRDTRGKLRISPCSLGFYVYSAALRQDSRQLLLMLLLKPLDCLMPPADLGKLRIRRVCQHRLAFSVPTVKDFLFGLQAGKQGVKVRREWACAARRSIWRFRGFWRVMIKVNAALAWARAIGWRKFAARDNACTITRKHNRAFGANAIRHG
jgi:hypothetical protein